MNNTELTSISEEELFFDIHQNNSLTTNKLSLEKTQINNDSGYYMSIVDSIDYLGCINGNCSKIECKCKPNEKCNCSNLSKTNLESNSSNSSNSSNGENNDATKKSNVNNFVSKLIDFLFVLILILLLTYSVYNKSSIYLIYCLGIIIVYIFYRMYITNML